jgi:hypothetical protein
MKHIMARLGANDRTQALTIALRRGLVQLQVLVPISRAQGLCRRGVFDLVVGNLYLTGLGKSCPPYPRNE